MINATHYIIDLETMGKGSNAAIAAIGCVEIIGGTISREIYRRVELSNSMAAGGTADADTIQWWLRQSAAARAEVNGTQSAELLFNVLGELRVFMTGMAHAHEILVWGNGATFDNVILSNAYAACGMERPWAYWNDRDLRTLLALYPQAKKLPFEGTKHHALDDARHEAHQLVNALQLHADHLRGAAQMIPPAGYILAPAEPTPAMVAAAEDAHMPFGDMHTALQCALHAAQQPEAA